MVRSRGEEESWRWKSIASCFVGISELGQAKIIIKLYFWMHIPCTVSIIVVRIAKADWRSAVQKAAAVYKPELVKLIRSSQFSAEGRGKKKRIAT